MDSIELKRLKIILLVSSVVALVLLVLAAYEERFAGTWRGHQAEYRGQAGALATSESSRAAAQAMDIGFRQVFLPDLKRVDRCTTCHIGIDDPGMADAALPIRTHSGNIFAHHPLDKFGCTVCHDGQGRAVDAETAHGEVEHWPAPLLRGELVYTSCSRCHYENDLYGWEEDLYARGGPLKFLDKTELSSSIPAVGTPRSLAITRGKQLLQRSGCLGCHKYRGRGGTLGPDITYVGDRTVHDFDFAHVEGEHTVAGWLFEHFKKPREIVPGTLMPDANLTDQQARDLTNYMLSLHRKVMPATHTPLPPRRSGEPVSGAQLFAMYCSSCHGKRGVGATVRDPAMAQVVDAPRELMTPSLNNLDTLAVASDDYLRQIITTGRQGTSMIDWQETGGLSRGEIDSLVAFIRGWEAAPPPTEGISSARGNPGYGRALYGSRCVGCHGLLGEGSVGGAALNTPAFLAVASDEFLRDSIVHGRANTAMPSWKQLDADQVSDLLAYIRTWQAKPPDKQAVLDRLAQTGKPGGHAEGSGEAVYQSSCATCHGSNGEGALGPSLNNDAFLSISDDEYLYTAIVEGRPGTAMPSWTHLAADELVDLINYLRGWNNHHRRELELFAARGDWDRGRIIYGGACAACHGAGAEGGSGPQLNNPVFLSSASDAMLREWISYSRMGTAMGAFLRGRHGVVEMTESQVEDVISYLRRFEIEPRVAAGRMSMGIVSLGAEIYADVCAGCHGPEEDEAADSDLTNPDFLRAASDGYLEATIVLERSMPELWLTAEDVSNVVAFIRGWEHEPPVEGIPARYVIDADIDAGEELFAGFCAGCHGGEGRGGWASELNNHEFLAAATDGFLQATIVRGRSYTAMRPFGLGGSGVAELTSEDINNIVAYVRTWARSENRPD